MSLSRRDWSCVHASREAQAEDHEADPEARLDDGSESDHAQKKDPPGLHGALHLFLLVTIGLATGLDRRSEAVAPLFEGLPLAFQVAGRVLCGLVPLLDRLLSGAPAAVAVSRRFSPRISRVSRPERGANRIATRPERAPTRNESTAPDIPAL